MLKFIRDVYAPFVKLQNPIRTLEQQVESRVSSTCLVSVHMFFVAGCANHRKIIACFALTRNKEVIISSLLQGFPFSCSLKGQEATLSITS